MENGDIGDEDGIICITVLLYDLDLPDDITLFSVAGVEEEWTPNTHSQLNRGAASVPYDRCFPHQEGDSTADPRLVLSSAVSSTRLNTSPFVSHHHLLFLLAIQSFKKM